MPTLLEQLTLHEGVRLFPYVDTVGKVTIGVGRNLTDVGISEEEALYLLKNDIDTATTALQRFIWFDDLDPIRRRVLIDMCFNLGMGSLQTFHGFLAAVARSDWETAADHMLESLWARQVKGRAVRLAQMIRSGEDYELPQGTVRA